MIYVTLASGWVDLVIISIAMVIAVGNAIAKAAKQNKTDKTPDLASESQVAAEAQRRQALAQKHREQLEHLLSGRQSDRPAASSPTAAQTLYERRAEALLRQQATQPRQQRATAGTNPRQLHDLSRVRQREIAQQRERDLTQKQAVAKRRQQAQKLGANVRQAVAKATRETDGRIGEHARVHRHVPDAIHAPHATASSSRPPKVMGITLNPKAMRQALILKEILEPPIAMRENHLGQ